MFLYFKVVPPFPQQDRHWATLCSGNPTNEIRGCDRYGCGYYGAPRYCIIGTCGGLLLLHWNRVERCSKLLKIWRLRLDRKKHFYCRSNVAPEQAAHICYLLYIHIPWGLTRNCSNYVCFQAQWQRKAHWCGCHLLRWSKRLRSLFWPALWTHQILPQWKFHWWWGPNQRIR